MASNSIKNKSWMSVKEVGLIHFFMVLCVIILLAVGCAQKGESGAAASQVRATDARGVEIVLPRHAERVVVLFEPFVDEMYMLGAGDKLVGIPQQVYQNSSSYYYLSQLDPRIAKKSIATPTFGGRSTHVEKVISLQADLAIVYEYDIETIAQLEGLDIPVFVVSSKDKAHIYDELINVGKLIGKKERAEDIVNYVNNAIEKIGSEVETVKKSVYYGWSKGRVFSTSGRGSLVDLAIQVAGAVNACPLEMEAPNVSAESIYKWNPDMIVLWNSDVEDVYRLAELAALPAVVNKQVFAMEPTFFFDPHTVKFLLFAKQLRHWGYQDYTTDQDFKDALQEIVDFLYEKKMSIE